MERVYERMFPELLDDIASGRLAAGMPFPGADDLAARYACGQSAAREAIRALEERRVIVVNAGEGQTVLDAQRWKLLDREVAEAALLRHGDRQLMREAVEFLRRFEPEAALLAAPRANRGNLTLLLQTLEQMRESSSAGNGAANRHGLFSQAEADFHRTLFQMSGNRFLASAFEDLHPVLAQARRQRAANRDPSVIRLHETIVAAVRERDAQAAAAAVEDYAKYLAACLVS